MIPLKHGFHPESSQSHLGAVSLSKPSCCCVSPARYPTPGTPFPLWEALWSPCLPKALEQLQRSSCHLCLCPMGSLGHVLPDNIVTICFSEHPKVCWSCSSGHWCMAREPGDEPSRGKVGQCASAVINGIQEGAENVYPGASDWLGRGKICCQML